MNAWDALVNGMFVSSCSRRRRVFVLWRGRRMTALAITLAGLAQIAVNFAPAIVALVALALVAKRQGWGL